MIKQKTVVPQATLASRGMDWGFLSVSVGFLSKVSLAVALVFSIGLVSLFIGVSLSLALLTGFGVLVIYKLSLDNKQNRSDEYKMSMALKASFEASIIRFDFTMKEGKVSAPWGQRLSEETAHQRKTDGSERYVLHQQKSRIKEVKRQTTSIEDDKSSFDLILKRFDEYELVLERTRYKLNEANNIVTGASNVIANDVDKTTLPTATNGSRLFSQRNPVVTGGVPEVGDFISETIKQ